MAKVVVLFQFGGSGEVTVGGLQFPSFGIEAWIQEDDSKVLNDGVVLWPGGIRSLKQANRSFESDLATAIELEATYQGIAVSTEDFKEGVLAFFEKRDPEFKGR